MFYVHTLASSKSTLGQRRRCLIQTTMRGIPSKLISSTYLHAPSKLMIQVSHGAPHVPTERPQLSFHCTPHFSVLALTSKICPAFNRHIYMHRLCRADSTHATYSRGTFPTFRRASNPPLCCQPDQRSFRDLTVPGLSPAPHTPAMVPPNTAPGTKQFFAQSRIRSLIGVNGSFSRTGCAKRWGPRERTAGHTARRLRQCGRRFGVQLCSEIFRFPDMYIGLLCASCIETPLVLGTRRLRSRQTSKRNLRCWVDTYMRDHHTAWRIEG